MRTPPGDWRRPTETSSYGWDETDCAEPATGPGVLLHPWRVTDDRLETLALNVACVVAAGFTAFVLGMWARTGETTPAAVVGMLMVWAVLAFGWFMAPTRRGLS